MKQEPVVIPRWRISKDWLWVLLPISLFLVFIAVFPCWILEDGYIMLRYARNIAYGFGVVYNPSDTPVWGNTSMLTTLALAALIRAGLVPVLASSVLGLSTGITLIIVVYMIERRILGLDIFPSIVSCCLLAISQLVSLALMGFDAVMFTLMMTLVFGASLWVVLRPSGNNSWIPLYAFAVVVIL
ncbi:MAG: hypothetical protein Q6361_04305, partial [Candidatus Hermodarchaeota archaeon]|nr:hypothetical protein [Candidatus Hermodarchaeota archaeon]